MNSIEHSCNFNINLFITNIKVSFERANSLVTSIGDFYWDNAYNDDVHFTRQEENDFNLERLEEVVHEIRLKLLYAYEVNNLSRMIQQLDSDLSDFESLNQVDNISYVDVFHSPVLGVLQMHLSAFTSSIPEISTSYFQMLLLEQILRGTGKIIADRSIVPKNEKEVQVEIYNTLIHVFPDTVREVPIPKISKTYKADIGVKSLKSAIEYKFVTSKEEMKKAIGGIFEDVHGYEGSLDWTTYYAVFYVTDNFMTVDQVKSEFKLSLVPMNWKPIIVYGKGERKENGKK